MPRTLDELRRGRRGCDCAPTTPDCGCSGASKATNHAMSSVPSQAFRFRQSAQTTPRFQRYQPAPAPELLARQPAVGSRTVGATAINLSLGTIAGMVGATAARELRSAHTAMFAAAGTPQYEPAEVAILQLSTKCKSYCAQLPALLLSFTIMLRNVLILNPAPPPKVKGSNPAPTVILQNSTAALKAFRQMCHPLWQAACAKAAFKPDTMQCPPNDKECNYQLATYSAFQASKACYPGGFGSGKECRTFMDATCQYLAAIDGALRYRLKKRLADLHAKWGLPMPDTDEAIWERLYKDDNTWGMWFIDPNTAGTPGAADFQPISDSVKLALMGGACGCKYDTPWLTLFAEPLAKLPDGVKWNWLP